MVRKGRKLRKFAWEKLLRKQLWNAQELAVKVGIAPICMRRYLRIYYEARRLERKRFGVYWYYAVARFVHPPDLSYPCPRCRARMEIYYVKKCGCEFSLCSIDQRHDVYKYCARHRIEKEPLCPKCKEPMELSVVGDTWVCKKDYTLVPFHELTVTAS